MNFIIEQITKPLFRRAGTALAAFLLAQDIPSGSVEIIVDGTVTALLVMSDLFFSYISRSKILGR